MAKFSVLGPVFEEEVVRLLLTERELSLLHYAVQHLHNSGIFHDPANRAIILDLVRACRELTTQHYGRKHREREEL